MYVVNPFTYVKPNSGSKSHCSLNQLFWNFTTAARYKKHEKASHCPHRSLENNTTALGS